MISLMALKELLESGKELIATNNFYYEDHCCPVTFDTQRVQLSYCLKQDDAIINFGKCPQCHAIYYHQDYESSPL